MNDIQHNLIDQIKAGKLHMKPRWHFLLITALYVVGTFLATVLAVYLLSFVLFVLRQNGIWLAPGLGLRGLSFFVISSPWLLIGLTVIFVALLYLLVKQFSFSYKRPLLYSILGIVILVLLGSYAISQTTMHDRVRSFSERHNLPALAPLYRSQLDKRPEGIFLGTIIETTPDGFTMTTDRNEQHTIHIIDTTRIRPGTVIEPETPVVVLGERADTTVTAYVIKNIAPGRLSPPSWREQGGQVITPLRKHREAAY